MEIKKNILARIGWIYLGSALVALAILAQVLNIQILEGEEWRLEAEKISQRPRVIPANRGDILARNGWALASTLPRYTLAIDPNSRGMADTAFYQQVDALSAGLSRLFRDRTPEQYNRLIRNARQQGKEYQVLQQRITFEEAEQVKKLPLFSLGQYQGGLILKPVTNREKPYELLAKRTIGYINRGESGTVVGLEGAYDHELKGQEGLRYEHRIGGSQWIPLSVENELDPADGLDVVSTIDIKYQDVAEQALYDLLQYHQAEHGCAILMEVSTGEILAIANLGRQPDGAYDEDFNYAIGERVEPGSTFKIPAVMAMLEDGLVTLQDTVNTFKGSYRFYDQVVEDAHAGGFGILTVREVIEKSSNVGMARLVDRHYRSDPKHFIDRLYAMGLNKPLNLDIMGERAPMIKSPGDTNWWGTTLPWMAHGYELEMTPLQMLTFYNAIANEGRMVKPRFVKGLRDHSQYVRKTRTEVIKNSICSKSTLQQVRSLLEGVVQRGTASNLHPEYYTIAGKTGTAVIQQGKHGYRDAEGNKAYRASFVGYFPADRPMFSCMVVISRPNMGEYTGNRVAGAVFKTIADKVYATTPKLHPTLTLAERAEQGPLPLVRPGDWNELTYLFKELNIPAHQPAVASELVTLNREGERLRPEPCGGMETLLPNLTGLGLRDVLPKLENKGIKTEIRGYGYIRSQSPPPGTPLDSIQLVKLHLTAHEEPRTADTERSGS